MSQHLCSVTQVLSVGNMEGSQKCGKAGIRSKGINLPNKLHGYFQVDLVKVHRYDTKCDSDR